MNKMTAEQILAAIEAAHISLEEFGECDFASPEGVGEWEEIEQKGGEDEGSYYTSVKYFKDHDVYILTVGYYQSYNGTEWYEGYGKEVKPVTKEVIFYE